MLIAVAATLMAQSAFEESLHADQALETCIRLATDDALLKSMAPEAFPSHLQRICGAQRDKWMKAKDAADGDDADPEGTYYSAKARFERAAADYSKRSAGY